MELSISAHRAAALSTPLPALVQVLQEGDTETGSTAQGYYRGTTCPRSQEGQDSGLAMLQTFTTKESGKVDWWACMEGQAVQSQKDAARPLGGPQTIVSCGASSVSPRHAGELQSRSSHWPMKLPVAEALSTASS